MPKRLDEARVLAAVAANDPPASTDHLDDDEWHAAQDMWLVKWSGSVLPDGPQRRLKWNDRVKEHARLVAAAARAVALPASMPRRKGARKAPVPTPHEPMQPANMPERASPARPPEDREDLGLPPLAAVSIEPQQHASAPAAASMFSLLSPPPQPPAQRTATERAAAERAAKKVRRAERERQTCAEGERALWLDEAARSSLAWRRISDPSSDDDLPSVLRAHPGDDASDVYERWCDYGPELMRGRPYKPQMPTKPPPLDVAHQPNLLALEARSLAGEYVGERNAAGQCEGRGKYVFADGAVYEGEFKAGKAEGRGNHQTAVGDVYEGELKAGKREGRGIYRYANGDVYEGEWKAGKKEGRGIYRSADGDVYEGEYKAGKKEGRGIARWADGNVYEGEFKAGIYQYASNVVCRAQPQEPHSAGAFEERRDLPASLQWKLELSDIMIEQLRYRHSKAHGMAARGEIQLELQQLLLERVGLDNRMANEKYYY